MQASDIFEVVEKAIGGTIGADWRHEVDIYGASSKHLNFVIDGVEYVLVLHKVEEGRNFSDYFVRKEYDLDKWMPIEWVREMEKVGKQCNNDLSPHFKFVRKVWEESGKDIWEETHHGG